MFFFDRQGKILANRLRKLVIVILKTLSYNVTEFDFEIHIK